MKIEFNSQVETSIVNLLTSQQKLIARFEAIMESLNPLIEYGLVRLEEELFAQKKRDEAKTKVERAKQNLHLQVDLAIKDLRDWEDKRELSLDFQSWEDHRAYLTRIVKSRRDSLRAFIANN